MVTLLTSLLPLTKGATSPVTEPTGKLVQICNVPPIDGLGTRICTLMLPVFSPMRLFVLQMSAFVYSVTVVGDAGGVTVVPAILHDGALLRSLTTPIRAPSRV